MTQEPRFRITTNGYRYRVEERLGSRYENVNSPIWNPCIGSYRFLWMGKISLALKTWDAKMADYLKRRNDERNQSPWKVVE